MITFDVEMFIPLKNTRFSFIPNEKTLVVVILGLNTFEKLCGPIKTAWFQKYSVEQHSYNKHQSHLFGWNHFA